MAPPSEHPRELVDRGIRLALEGERPIAHIARGLGIEPESLRRRAEIDAGQREGLTTNEREEFRFIDEHRARFGVEPICRTVEVSTSAY